MLRTIMVGLFYMYFLIIIISFLEPTRIFIVADDHGDVSEAWGLCKHELTELLPPPYRLSASFTCAPIWKKTALSFYQNQDNVTTIVLSGKLTSQWVGIGFSKDGKMVGSSAMVGWVSDDGKSSIKQYFLHGKKDASQVIPDKGDLDLTKVAPVVSRQEGITHLGFQVKSSNRLGGQPIILALGDGIPPGNSLTKHVESRSTTVDFSSGTSSFLYQDPETTKMIHGILAILGWGTLIPLGALVPKHLRHRDPFWFYCHSTMNFLGFSLGLASVSNGRLIIDQVEDRDPVAKRYVLIHRNIGVALVILCAIQLLTFIVKSPKEPEAKYYRFWFMYHRCAGMLIIILAYCNIVFGVTIGKAEKAVRMVMWTSAACYCITSIVLELKTCFKGDSRKRHNDDLPPPIFHADDA
ncbi:hypothetical protein Pint_14922 [Pistacia integerrima]|uniref:Uncharacterized protein n=1 Tax=Pistacia integerrima TaxID=434235 RepID=A0ACC0ZDA9_9ROSI|nr:hypothetical protein Pint_14922 [Pistacia integerrima]